MAKKKRRGKGGVNKSQEIRNYLAKKPGAMPKEIKEALGKRGIEVTDGLISQIKYTSSPKKKKTKKRGRPKGSGSGRKATATKGRRGRVAISNGVTYDALFEAKALADRIGGIDKAKEALTMLEKLT